MTGWCNSKQAKTAARQHFSSCCWYNEVLLVRFLGKLCHESCAVYLVVAPKPSNIPSLCLPSHSTTTSTRPGPTEGPWLDYLIAPLPASQGPLPSSPVSPSSQAVSLSSVSLKVPPANTTTKEQVMSHTHAATIQHSLYLHIYVQQAIRREPSSDGLPIMAVATSRWKQNSTWTGAFKLF
jgi:hypothetical protein